MEYLSNLQKYRIVVYKYDKPELSLAKIAELAKIQCKSTVKRILDKFEVFGSVENLPKSGRNEKLDEKMKEKINNYLTESNTT